MKRELCKLLFNKEIVDLIIDGDAEYITIPALNVKFLNKNIEEYKNKGIIKIPISHKGDIGLVLTRVGCSNLFVSTSGLSLFTSDIPEYIGDRVIVNHERRLINRSIPRNASSNFLRQSTNGIVSYKFKGNESFLWDSGGFLSEAREKKILLTNKELFEDSDLKTYHQFSIIRDPIDRFVSVVNSSRDPLNSIGIPYNFNLIFSDDWKSYTDVFISICRCVKECVPQDFLKNRYYFSQKRMIGKFDDSLTFVKFEDVKSFLDEYGMESSLVDWSREKLIDKDDLDENQIKELKEIFSDDYELMKTIKYWNNNDYCSV